MSLAGCPDDFSDDVPDQTLYPDAEWGAGVDDEFGSSQGAGAIARREIRQKRNRELHEQRRLERAHENQVSPSTTVVASVSSGQQQRKMGSWLRLLEISDLEKSRDATTTIAPHGLTGSLAVSPPGRRRRRRATLDGGYESDAGGRFMASPWTGEPVRVADGGLLED